jgi:hypothetical protein
MVVIVNSTVELLITPPLAGSDGLVSDDDDVSSDYALGWGDGSAAAFSIDIRKEK